MKPQITQVKSQITQIRAVYNLCNPLIICAIIFILWYTHSAYGAEEKPVPPSPVGQVIEEGKREAKPILSKVEESEDKYTYDPADKRDPFRSLILGKKEKLKLEEEKKKIEEVKEEERFKTDIEKIPFTPLQEFDLSSIKVVAIIWGDIGNYALVEAPDGKGYTVKKGIYIGKSRGIVKNITDKTLVVEEKYRDMDKKVKTRTVELRLKKEE